MRKTGRFLTLIFLLTFSFTFFGCQSTSSKGTSYHITCSLSGNELTGEEKVNFVNEGNNCLSQLKFNLHANAFRKGAKYSPIAEEYKSQSYPNGVSYGDMKIDSVLIGEKKANFSIGGEDENILIINLEEELFPNERVEVVIFYTLNLANVIARTGVNSKTINLANFYPILCALDQDGFYECVYYSCGDPYYSDVANYTVDFTCDSEYTVASSGNLKSSSSKGNKTQMVYEIKDARSFCLVLCKDYKVLTDNALGVNINYYYYDDQTPNSSMQYAIKSLKTFTQRFGNYPYKTYSVCQTQFIQGGMEFPALVMISDALEPKAYGEVIVHETAHQWWQTTVGNNEIEHSFLDEGLAEYSVVVFYEDNAEYGYTRQSLINSSKLTYKTFCSVQDKVLGKIDTSMLRGLKDFTSEYEYVNVSYVKTCLMYDILRQTIGDHTFFDSLKNYYEQFSFKNATPYDLVGCFEKTGADTNGFFETFFFGKEIL